MICLRAGEDDSIHQLVYSTDDSTEGKEMFSLLINMF